MLIQEDCAMAEANPDDPTLDTARLRERPTPVRIPSPVSLPITGEMAALAEASGARSFPELDFRPERRFPLRIVLLVGFLLLIAAAGALLLFCE